jgi:diguanylate cyclase (GGDEF)-like protein/PAS domain S-box-containing protein
MNPNRGGSTCEPRETTPSCATAPGVVAQGGGPAGAERAPPLGADAVLACSRQAIAVVLAGAAGGWPWIASVNPAFTTLTGFAAADVVGQDLGMLLDADADGSALAALRQAMANGREHRDELLCSRRDGGPFAAELDAVPVARSAGDTDLRVPYLVTFTDLTDSRLEQVVADAMAEYSGEVYSILDVDGLWRWVSRSVTEVLGYEPSELMGRPFSDLVHPDDLEDSQEHWAQRLADPDGTPARESRVRHRDGSWRWLKAVGLTAVNDPLIGGVLVAARDVTLRRELEDRLARATDAAQLGVWDYDLATGEIRSNDQLSLLFGMALPGADRMGVFARQVHPDDATEVHAAFMHALTRLGRFELTYRIIRPDGGLRWIINRGEVLPGETGAPSHAVGVIIDATDYHQAHELVVQTLESITDGYFSCDADWRATYINETGTALLGPGLLGRVLWEAFPEAVGTFGHAEYQRCMAERVPVTFETHYGAIDRWYEVRGFPLAQGGIAVYFHDVHERHAAQAEQQRLIGLAEQANAELARAATHDPLTDLPNRTELSWRMERAFAHWQRGEPGPALLYVDLDDFKIVNDSLGHATGDAVLVEATQRLVTVARDADAVCRFGGDEFVILLRSATEAEALVVAQRVVAAFRVPLRLDVRSVVVSASVGVAVAGPDSDPATLLRDADSALYQAKDEGRDRCSIFDDAVRATVMHRMDVEAGLREALDDHRLVAHYQPSFDLVSGKVCGFEALARWDHPERGLLAAGLFIPIAERTDLVLQIGVRVLELACSQAIAWRERWVGRADPVWVNVSARGLCRPRFAADVIAILDAQSIDDGEIGIEVTESALMRDPEEAARQLAELRSRGVRLAIDDFGTGYSSLAYLQRYPFDLIKIDRTFVADLRNPGTKAITAAVIQLAHSLGAAATAEGVETLEQLAELRRLGCDTACGYLLGRPADGATLDPRTLSIDVEPRSAVASDRAALTSSRRSRATTP